ncbi:hypothetical protein [Methylobacterium sp. Leaf111]|uniref:hypothetical protein n=1 Tax=Methylobacterium sp. Leaf111 TaxID=1736257 RepID=UPI0012E7131D|nr:hypothetical protein [Methylobacterium sp. Leaf111]
MPLQIEGTFPSRFYACSLLKRAMIGAIIALAYIPGADAECGSIPFNVSQPMIERIALDRDALKRMFPQGGDGLSFWVTTIATSSRAALPSVIWTLKIGNENQREATIIGLARAAQECQKTNKVTARQIEQAVKNLSDPSIARRFANAFSGHDRSEPASRNSVSKLDQPAAASISTGSAVLPELKGQNGINLTLSNDEKAIPPIQAVVPYQKIR